MAEAILFSQGKRVLNLNVFRTQRNRIGNHPLCQTFARDSLTPQCSMIGTGWDAKMPIQKAKSKPRRASLRGSPPVQ